MSTSLIHCLMVSGVIHEGTALPSLRLRVMELPGSPPRFSRATLSKVVMILTGKPPAAETPLTV
ncbi:hypothetical protein D3C71_1878280 [compost metagenome]